MKYWLILFFISPWFLAASEPESIASNCTQYMYSKAYLDKKSAKNQCQKIKDRFAWVCTKVAINYLDRNQASSYLEACSKIDNEKKLKCVVDEAIMATSHQLKKIKSCS